MPKIFISDNYLIYKEDSGLEVPFGKSSTHYDERADHFQIEDQESGKTRTIAFSVILSFLDINDDPYTVSGLRTLLRQNTKPTAETASPLEIATSTTPIKVETDTSPLEIATSTTPIKVETGDFMLDRQRGIYPGQSVFTALGRSIELTTGNTPQDVWMKGGLYGGRIASAGVLEVISTSVNDTLLGTGARKVFILGLDNAGLEVSEEVDLNGTTAVATVNSYKRVNAFYVTSAGSLTSNEGGIDLRLQSAPATIMSYIEIGHSYAQSAHWSVPSDETWYMIGVDGLLYDDSASGNRAVMEFIEFDPVSNVKSRYLDFSVSTDGSVSKLDVQDRFVMRSGTDWWMRVTDVAANGARASFNGIFLRIKN